MIKFILMSILYSTNLFANGILDRAYEQYLKRDFTPDGILSADNARHNFGQVVNKLFNVEGEYARSRNLMAAHFLLQTETDKKDRILSESMGQAASGLFYFQKTFGNNPFKNEKMSLRAKKIFADQLYWQAEINIYENKRSSIRWKKITSDMQSLVNFGYGCMNDGGAFRLLGMKYRNEKDMTRSLVHFKKAYECTLLLESENNWNGKNILNYAEVLWEAGKKDLAVNLLQNFISQSVELLSIDFIPENRLAQKEAAIKLKNWGHARIARTVLGEYLVKFKNSLTANQQITGFVVKDKISSDIFLYKADSHQLISNPLTYLKQNSDILIVEPNYIYKASALPNDSDLSKAWGIHNRGQLDAKGNKGLIGVDIGALKAWELTTGSRDVVVAVIDTGIDFSSSELKPNAWINEKEKDGTQGVDDDGNGYIDDIHGYDFVNNSGLMIDDNGHGTHVAGIIGAQGNDGVGVAGVNWNVRIMALKFLTERGDGDLANAIRAVKYATKMGAMVTNNSWGGGAPSELLKEAIEEANRAGILFVAASGNSGENADVLPEMPAAYGLPNIISVAAVNNRGRLSNFSNFGARSVDIGAPGENIYSTIPDGKYASWSGTSMAAPFVTGVVALLLSNEPTLSMSEVKERILKSSAPLASLRGRTRTGGMVDAYAALTKGEPRNDPYDPLKWKYQEVSVHTEHNYSDRIQKDYQFKIPEASAITLHFSDFRIEPDFDKVYFTDSENRLLGVWSGTHNDEFAPFAEGSFINMKFVTDSLTTEYGFLIDKILYRD